MIPSGVTESLSKEASRLNRPIPFGIQAENPDRAIAFYRSLSGWTFTQWGDQKYWLIATGDKATPGMTAD